jgi:hypothetical protein
MSDGETAAPEPADLPAEIREAVPTWRDDEYLDRVSDRLMYSYDLERDYAVRGHSFPMYAELRIENQKQFLHPALNYADHETREHLFARRAGEPTVADLEALVDLGHDLAEDWVDGHEEHYETNFTFVLVADAVPDAVRSFVSGFRDRTLLKYGYYGAYEVNLVVVAPDDEDGVASQEADVLQAFALWGDVDRPDEGFFSRLAKRFWS